MSEKVHIHNHTLHWQGLPDGITLKPGVRDEVTNAVTPGVTVVDAAAWAKAKKEHVMVQAHLAAKHFVEKSAGGEKAVVEKFVEKTEKSDDADKKPKAAPTSK